jgi:hypothetical protein
MKTSKIITVILLFLCVNFLPSCNDSNDDQNNIIKGTGELVSQTRILGSFNGISLVGQGKISITKGDSQKVVIRAQQNVLDVLTSDVYNNDLAIGSHNKNIQTTKGIFFDITTPNPITLINITGAGDLNIAGDKQNILMINIVGAGEINAYNLEVNNCTISISGTGDCKVKVDSVLNVNISGVGNILYKGYPVINQSISGSGSIKADN